MIQSLSRKSSRPRPTIARLMGLILVVGLLLGLTTILAREEWPFRDWASGGIRLGILFSILYLPVVPALVLWRRWAPGRRGETTRRTFVALAACYLAWAGVLFLTIRSMLATIGL